MNLENFITFLNTTPTGRAAIPPAGSQSYEHINAGGTRVRQDPVGLLWDFRLANVMSRGGPASECGESAKSASMACSPQALRETFP